MNPKIKAIFLVLVMCCLLFQCYNRRWVDIPDRRNIPIEDKIVILHWNEHQLGLYNAQIMDDQIHGHLTVYFPAKPYFSENETKRFVPHINALRNKKQLHIHLDSTVILKKPFSGNLSIPLHSIEKIESLDLELNREKTSVAVLGATGLFFLTISIIEWAQKPLIGDLDGLFGDNP